MNIIIAGDFAPMNRIEDKFQNSEYRGIVNGLGGGKIDDLFIVNFETVISGEKGRKIIKIGPHLQCSTNCIPFLKQIGVDAVTMANNHTMDYGDDGMMNTISVLHKAGIETVGIGINLEEAKKPLFLKQKGETVAIINCCEHEFSYAEENKVGANPLNPIQQYYSIQEAKTKANYVVVIVHGGHEHYDLPTPRMVQTYRFFIDSGADAVINHHQHCYSGYEYYKDKPIYYGLGNFCFDGIGKDINWFTGYCVRLHLGDTISSEELPYIQCKENAVIQFGEFDGFRSNIERLNKIIQDSDQLRREADIYFESQEAYCNSLLTPFGNHYAISMVRRGLIPSFISKRKKLMWKGYVDCESHRDTVLHYLKKNI